MALYQMRQRDPLVDPATQAALARRARELIGIGLLAAATIFTAMLLSYSPEDPGWMAASDQPVSNWLGGLGAAIASTLVNLVGRAAWAIPLMLLAWGLRHVLHRGAERAGSRVVFALIAVAVAAAFASTHVPGEAWDAAHKFGLGGYFGDTVMGTLLGVVPVKATFGLKVLSLIMGLATLAIFVFVTGFDRYELEAIKHFLAVGSVMTYAQMRQWAGQGSAGALQAAQGLQERQRQRRAESAALRAAEAEYGAEYEPRPNAPHHLAPVNLSAPPPMRGVEASTSAVVAAAAAAARRNRVIRAEAPPAPVVEDYAVFETQEADGYDAMTYEAPPMMAPQPMAPRKKEGLLGRLFFGAPEPELPEYGLSQAAQAYDAAAMGGHPDQSDDRIKARISDVIRSRVRNGMGAAAPQPHMTPLQAAIARREPALARRGAAQLGLRHEPPVMAPIMGHEAMMTADPAAHMTAVSAAVAGAAARAAAAQAHLAEQQEVARQQAPMMLHPAQRQEDLAAEPAVLPSFHRAAVAAAIPTVAPVVRAVAQAQAAPLRAAVAVARSPAAAAAAEAVAAAIRAGAARAQAAAAGEPVAPVAERPAPLGRPQMEAVAEAEVLAAPEPVAVPVAAPVAATPMAAKPVLRAEPRMMAPVAAKPVSRIVTAPQPVDLQPEAEDDDWMLPEAPADWQEDTADLTNYRPAAPAPAFLRRGAVSAPAITADAEDWHPEDMADLDEDEAMMVPVRQPQGIAPRHGAALTSPEAKRAVVQHALKKPVPQSARAVAEAQPRLRFEDQVAQAYELPPLSLLASASTVQRHTLSDEALEENARMLESVLDDYGVKGEIVSVRPGPVVTMYELEPAPGLKASRVIGLADDIARSMSALSARVSTVPGRSVIGIELPNATREKVVLREILAARDFGDSNMRLPLALGKDIGGDAVVANLSKMPHLLIAGTTGSGKSVAINTMILSLLYKLTPEECRLIMIDPKMLELSVYDGIPHLLSPVVTDPKKAVVALKWVVGEMEERYRKMSKMGVRNIDGYNGRVREALAAGEMFKRTIQTGFDDATGEPVFETEEFAPVTLPYIVVVVDEMADLMMVAGKEIEACIQRLAQMARASGIHLIMATQRPSVDVITGTIKANFPTRISFQVTSKIDSRTILGEQGAEQLLGQGDMLYMGNGQRITRIHGPFVSDEEVEEIVNHLKSFGPPQYMSGVVEGPEDDVAGDIDAVLGLGAGDGEDALYDQAVAIVAKDRKCSTSYIQRKLGIGYNKAARLVEQMEQEGVVTTANHVGKREILIPEA